MFETKDSIVLFMKNHGVERIVFKCLAENDNIKQQIYFGGSFEAINIIPFGSVTPGNIDGKQPNFKAALDFSWIGYDGKIEPAPGAQLILYPKYPEVRLSGIVQNCKIAPRDHLQPVLRTDRKFFNNKDGRVLVLGLRPDGQILAYLVPADTVASSEFLLLADNSSLFTHINITANLATKDMLLSKIQDIQSKRWLPGCRLNRKGQMVNYSAINAGGYTLEAHMGIIPNGKSEPDWEGWELKAFTGSRITLMTPEPDGGFYGEFGVAEFVEKYGHETAKETKYFTGTHRFGRENQRTNMCMVLEGYDAQSNKIVNITGGLVLLDSNEDPAALWTFSKLIEHWGKKHAHAAYIPYEVREENGTREYAYTNPVKIGEGTDFSKFLTAFISGKVYYDPGNKITFGVRKTTKARNQFRMNPADLNLLYSKFSNEFIETEFTMEYKEKNGRAFQGNPQLQHVADPE